MASLPAAAAPSGRFEGTWSWGSPRRSAEVPFLRIAKAEEGWSLETKNYMHDTFESQVRELRIDGNHLTFAYWYAPLARWATCNLDLTDDMMSGTCEGELNARDWGAVPTWLWRVKTPGPQR